MLHLFSFTGWVGSETPLKAVQEFAAETDKQKLTPAQKLFVYEWVYKYVKNSEFDNMDATEIKDLLKSQQNCPHGYGWADNPHLTRMKMRSCHKNT